MRISEEFRRASAMKVGRIVAALFASLAAAHGQKYEITPFVGGVFGGTIELEQPGVHNFDSHVEDRLSFGVSGAIRFDAEDCKACNAIGFRWARQNSHLRLHQDPTVVTPFNASPFHPAVTFDHFLADFSREWNLNETRLIKPFLSVSLGAARLATPAASTTRFVFGIGTGISVFPKPHWGFRAQVEYLPMVMHADLERVVCAVNCIVALSGGVMNQFQLSIGPSFRF